MERNWLDAPIMGDKRTQQPRDNLDLELRYDLVKFITWTLRDPLLIDKGLKPFTVHPFPGIAPRNVLIHAALVGHEVEPKLNGCVVVEHAFFMELCEHFRELAYVWKFLLHIDKVTQIKVRVWI